MNFISIQKQDMGMKSEGHDFFRMSCEATGPPMQATGPPMRMQGWESV